MSQVEIEVLPIAETTTPKPKRGRPKKQVHSEPQVETPSVEPQVETVEAVAEEPQVDTTPTEPQVETVAAAEPEVEAEPSEPSPQPEEKSTIKVKKQVVKRAPRRKLGTHKVEVAVEELHHVSPEETEEQVEEPATPYVSVTNQITQQRIEHKTAKSEKYKRLLQGNL
jgi:hypothetical protein